MTTSDAHAYLGCEIYPFRIVLLQINYNKVHGTLLGNDFHFLREHFGLQLLGKALVIAAGVDEKETT